MQIIIRPTREDDAPAIVDILNPLIEAGTHTVITEPVTLEDQLAFMRGFPPRGVYHVAVDETHGAIVGLQDVRPCSSEPALHHVGEISTFVSLASQRRGVGRTLTRATIASAHDRGFQKIVATIRADNPHALGFYGSQDFHAIGTARRHAFVRGVYVDEVMMERWIG